MRRSLWGAALALLALPLFLLASSATASAVPMPTMSVSDAWVVEPGSGSTASAVFTVTLSAPAVGGERVHWAPTPGSAVPADFVAGAGDLTFAPDETTQSISVDVTGDDV